MGRLAANRAATVDRLTDAARRADRLAAASRKALDQQKKLAAQQKKQRDAVNGKLREVEGLLATSPRSRSTSSPAWSSRAWTRPSGSWWPPGRSAPPGRPPGRAATRWRTRSGRSASRACGAEGPDSFDCSGLTSQASVGGGADDPAHLAGAVEAAPEGAGVRAAPRDLVIYFPKATHVALYIGDGLVVQAPAPARRSRSHRWRRTRCWEPYAPTPGGAPLSTLHPPGAARGRAGRCGHGVRNRRGTRVGSGGRTGGAGPAAEAVVGALRPRRPRPGRRSSSRARRRSSRSPPGC